MISMIRPVATILLTLTVLTPALYADVSSVHITERRPLVDGHEFGNIGPYEEILGKITFAIDPTDPKNQVIANLDRAPTNTRGMVEATADLIILTPADAQRGNGIALVDIANRGRLSALSFNRGGSGRLGDGFLMQEGYTVVWVGWEFDVPGERPIQIEVPTVDGFPVGGLGFAAVRDTASWIKHDPEALVNAKHLISFGSSQSGRFLRTFLYLGFNTDESGKQVFDGMIPHIAGSSRIDLNQPGATPISLGMFNATSFPFADAPLRDPVTRAIDGTLGNDRSRDNQPLIFYTNTGVEYWGGGRVAALVHSLPDGTKDITLPDNIRFYLFSGTQHSPGQFPPPPSGNRQELGNPIDYWWSMRALLTSLKEWIVNGVEPPPSRHPQFAHGNLVTPQAVNFPAIPGVRSPRDRQGGTRTANPLLAEDAGKGEVLPILVPQVDEDGNETSGIRHPEVAVPLATYTGWNFTSSLQGDPDTLVALAGSYIPFPTTRAEREKSGDPRRSIEERYQSREHFLTRIKLEANLLVEKRYLLQNDVDSILDRASIHWDYLFEVEQ